MNLEQLEAKHRELGEEIERLKREGDYVLRLRVTGSSNALSADITVDGELGCLGFIRSNGGCSILNTTIKNESLKLWREKGMKILNESVKWKDARYAINNDGVLLNLDTMDNGIYDFKQCCSIVGCEDTTIIRHEHNNRPILF